MNNKRRLKKRKARREKKRQKRLQRERQKTDLRRARKLGKEIEDLRKKKLTRILRERLNIPDDEHYSLKRLWEIAKARNVDLTDVLNIQKDE